MVRRVAGAVKAQLWWALLVMGSLGCFCNPPDNLDRCDDPTTTAVDSVEIGTVSSDRVPAEGFAFVPAADGDLLFVVRGFQGADMVGLRFRVRGGGNPACVGVKVTLKSGGREIVSDELAMDTHGTDEGQVTSVLWLQGEYPAGRLEVAATVAQQSKTISAELVHELSCADENTCPCWSYADCRTTFCSAGSDCERDCRKGLTTRALALADGVQDCVAALCRDEAVDAGEPGDGGLHSDAGSDGCRSDACRRCVEDATSASCGPGAAPGCGTCRAPWEACVLSPP